MSAISLSSFERKLKQWIAYPFYRLLNVHLLFPIRQSILTKKLSKYLTENCLILDLGSSDGALAYSIQTHLAKQGIQAEFTGCDVHIQPNCKIPVIPYDGERLPFATNQFDVVTIVDVLHHAKNPLAVLKEAIRVAKKQVLIKDHYWTNQCDLLGLRFSDYIGNRPFNIHLPYNYFRESEWLTLLDKLNVKLEHIEKFRYALGDPCKHILMNLSV
ncbi:MAG: methyltransferase domain-containing protein [Thermostichus sp. DG_1_6_bins_120]